MVGFAAPHDRGAAAGRPCRGWRACLYTPAQSSPFSRHPPSRCLRSSFDAPRSKQYHAPSGSASAGVSSPSNRHRSIKCSWAADRSLRFAAFHFLMNSVGVIDIGYPGDGVIDPIQSAYLLIDSSALADTRPARLPRDWGTLHGSVPIPCHNPGNRAIGVTHY